MTLQNVSDIKSTVARLGECPICISATKVFGPGLERALMGQEAEFVIQLFDTNGKVCVVEKEKNGKRKKRKKE